MGPYLAARLKCSVITVYVVTMNKIKCLLLKGRANRSILGRQIGSVEHCVLFPRLLGHLAFTEGGCEGLTF